MSRLKIKKKRLKPVHYDQWIEISTASGNTIAEFYPPNVEFERLRQERESDRDDKDGRATYIYRRVFFRGGVPEEYCWIKPDPRFKQYGGLYLERMSVADWLAVMDAEAKNDNKTFLPCATPLRRPEAYGPCPCARCQANPDRLPELVA